jgi:hypothetical protein
MLLRTRISVLEFAWSHRANRSREASSAWCTSTADVIVPTSNVSTTATRIEVAITGGENRRDKNIRRLNIIARPSFYDARFRPSPHTSQALVEKQSLQESAASLSASVFALRSHFATLRFAAFNIPVLQSSQPQIAIQGAVLNSFREMFGLEIFSAVEVGYGSSNFEKPNNSLRASLDAVSIFP